MGSCLNCPQNENIQFSIQQFPSRTSNINYRGKLGTNQKKYLSPQYQLDQRTPQNKVKDHNTASSLNNIQNSDIELISLQDKQIDKLIKKAEQQSTAKQYQQSENSYKQALKMLQSKDQKSIQTYQKIALCNSNLINLILLAKQKRDIQQYAKGALQIYDSNEGIYYEQKIVLLNSISLHLQKNGKLKEAIQAQKQILSLQEMYYPKNDERKILTSNNIACYYYENCQEKQGNQLFIDLLKKTEINDEIRNAIQANHQFYSNRNAKNSSKY